MERKPTLKMMLTLLLIATLAVTFYGKPVAAVLQGDLDGDGKVDGKDVAIVAAAFGTQEGDPRWNPDADLNDDGKIDGRDVWVVASNFGSSE